jgi:hypothetical protein
MRCCCCWVPWFQLQHHSGMVPQQLTMQTKMKKKLTMQTKMKKSSPCRWQQLWQGRRLGSAVVVHALHVWA